MERNTDKAGSARHAITDVYDEERRTFLVRFPRGSLSRWDSAE